MNYLIWDFDETLGYSEGKWGSALLDVVRQELPGHPCTIEALRPALQSGFPWHTPEIPAIPPKSPRRWWDDLDPLFERAFRDAGIEPVLARRLAGRVRLHFPRLDRWRLFDDAEPALRDLSSRGWTHLLLSNHVPELRAILRHLGVEGYFADIFNSAETGYEKPHPRAFLAVLDTIGRDAEAWMIGDNPRADVAGAEAVGLRAILVRRHDPEVRYRCNDLSGIGAIVEGERRRSVVG
jgi:putative hydrolase of the HAD superfamily